MVKQITLTLNAPSVEAPILKLLGLPQANRLLISIQNLSKTDDASYKFQESSDGVSWSNKSFPVGEDEVVTFELEANTVHPFKVEMTQPHLRLHASGDVTLQVTVQYNMPHDPDEQTQIFL